MTDTHAGTAREAGFSFGGTLRREEPVVITLPKKLPEKSTGAPRPAYSLSASPSDQRSEAYSSSEKQCWVKDGCTSNIELPGGDLEPLKSLCSQATCGLDGENVVSPTHRRALQLSPADFQSNFRLEDTSILQEIAQFAKPWPGKEVTATLTALNVYGPGDHFKQHQDTPFRDKGFGTLVIALPNVYKGGCLRVWDEQGEVGVDHDWCRELGRGEASIKWAFVALGCWHEVQPVTSGHRITLVYSLQGSNASSIMDAYRGRSCLFDVAYYPGRRRTGRSTTTFRVKFLPADGNSGSAMMKRMCPLLFWGWPSGQCCP